MPGKMSKGKAMPAKGGKPKPKKMMKPARGLSKAMQAEQERNKKRGNRPF